MSDPINPKHYQHLPGGIEAIDVCQHLNFCLGNVVKYVIRCGKKETGKDAEIEDLRKAAWYLDKEIERIQNET